MSGRSIVAAARAPRLCAAAGALASNEASNMTPAAKYAFLMAAALPKCMTHLYSNENIAVPAMVTLELGHGAPNS
jgi:hypothetical protein